MAILFNVDHKDKHLDAFSEYLDNVEEEGQKAVYTNLSIAEMLPGNMNKFYRYRGSLTTPGCDEVVVWTILEGKFEISQTLIDELRELRYGVLKEPRTPISDNFRDVQPLNGREVLYVEID